MVKKEILKHYRSSLKKWESMLKDVKAGTCRHYHLAYWNKCGFCEVFGLRCSKCPLYKRKYEGRRYCNNRIKDFSGAIKIIRLAESGEFVEAERLCTQFIKIMKQEIEKVKND
jgi:hypothetical protein